MTERVNPPPNLRRPKKIQGDPELEAYFRDMETIIFQLWRRTGGGTDLVDEAVTNFNINFSSAIFDIREQIGSGIPVTIDTTGFTVDTTEQTTDKTEV